MKAAWIALALIGAAVFGGADPALARGACPHFTPEETRGRPEYRNSDGCVIPVPEKETGERRPPDATARCRDGSWSFSQHHRGTCSRHGGVAMFLR